MKLQFGKYKGYSVEDVPADYLWWLTCWDLDDSARVKSIWADYDGQSWQERVRDFLEDAPNCAHKYLLRKHIRVVWEARKIYKQRRYCAWCHETMPAIGHAREGGADHPDWKTRMLHKQCWQEVKF